MAPDDLLPSWTVRVESTLDRALSGPFASERLAAAMRHAVLGGGKRLRPLLTYAAGHALGAKDESLDAAAAAIELTHAFSLVHDDLPAMDDDVLRRGRPTVHVAFDEATAILTGDALQALAFELLAQAPLAAETRIALVAELAHATGARGMCAGQAQDMQATGKTLDLSALQQMQSLKTGALIRAAVRMGVRCAGADDIEVSGLDEYATALGLAFQIRDDLLDVEGSAAQLGKTAGKDGAQGKSTYPSVLGLHGSRLRLAELAAMMEIKLRGFGAKADALRAIGLISVERIS